MKIKAVAFDVDGTLYDNNEMFLKSIVFGLKNVKLLHALRSARQHMRNMRPIDDFYMVQATLVGHKMGWDTATTYEILDKRIYRDWEKVLDHLDLLPDVKETIAALREKGLKLAVASDFPVERKMGLLGLDGMWDFELSTERTGYLKPHPEPFMAIAKALQLEPAEILYVGNSYSCDIVGAKAVGMSAAHYTRRPRRNSVADFHFSRYLKLLEWILQNS